MQIGSGISIGSGVKITSVQPYDPGGSIILTGGLPGLYRRIYNGYFGDNPRWFDTASLRYRGVSYPTVGLSGFDTGDLFSVQWLGYFKPVTTGLHTFYTNSDEGSYLWIGANAVSKYKLNNALVKNGGLHTATEKRAATLLTAGQYYPIRLQYGEYYGAQVMSLAYSSDAAEKTTNFTNMIYYNSATNGF